MASTREGGSENSPTLFSLIVYSSRTATRSPSQSTAHQMLACTLDSVASPLSYRMKNCSSSMRLAVADPAPGAPGGLGVAATQAQWGRGLGVAKVDGAVIKLDHHLTHRCHFALGGRLVIWKAWAAQVVAAIQQAMKKFLVFTQLP